MHTYSLAAAFLSAVTASPVQDFSPFEYVLPSSGQPNNAPIPFQDFFAQTNTNPDGYNLEQPQILSQSPSTTPDIYEFVKPQILAESPDQRMVETVRGDSLGGNEPLPVQIIPSTENYLPSDLEFQHAQCDTTSSVCCQRVYNGESSHSATCAASTYFRSPFSSLLPRPQIGSPACASEKNIEFAGLDRTPMMDSRSAKFGRYCLAPVYFSDCNQMWEWVWVSLHSLPGPPFPHLINSVCPFTAGSVQDGKEEVFSLTWLTMQKQQGTTGYDCYTECERVLRDRGHPAT